MMNQHVPSGFYKTEFRSYVNICIQQQRVVTVTTNNAYVYLIILFFFCSTQ